jgi:hypothetical protein
MPQEITITLTDEQAGQLRELSDHWGVPIEEALRQVASDAIGPALHMALHIKPHDEREAAVLLPEYDDGIPF